MSREKQIEEMAEDLRYCHTEFAGDYGDIYTDYHKTAEKLVVIGYRKQSELTPCDCCKFNPPSSTDGKPCSMCPAQVKMKGGAE